MGELKGKTVYVLTREWAEGSDEPVERLVEVFESFEDALAEAKRLRDYEVFNEEGFASKFKELNASETQRENEYFSIVEPSGGWYYDWYHHILVREQSVR